jgi:arylsulfatase A-like enzyme
MITTSPSRRSFLGAISAGAAGMSLSNCGGTKQRPNILYIMSDDHTTNAIRSYGGRLESVAPTHHIDRIANEGMRLENCFCTNSICVPSRATILTGQYSHVNGVYTLAEPLDRDRPNVAKMLQQGGYQTAVVGKWHLKSEPSGFDYYNILRGQGRYNNPQLREIGNWEGEDFSKVPGDTYEGHSTDVITDQSLQWLNTRDETKPFYLMCHFKATHGPWDYNRKYEHLFDGVEIPEPESLWEDLSHRSPGSRNIGLTIDTQVERMSVKNYPTGPLDIEGLSLDEARKAAYQKYLKDYLRCVKGIDDNVGRLLQYLDDNGLADNTIVVYTSDQGMFLGEHNLIDKRWIFEESARMPFLVRYPREIAPGSVNENLILNSDFAPMFLDYAGLPTPGDMQGASFREQLNGDTPTDWRQSMYYHYWMQEYRPAHYGIRTKTHKLIFFYGLTLGMTNRPETPPGWELYDLVNDPQELHNVYDDPANAEIIRQLTAEMDRWKVELGDTDDKYPELQKLRQSM